MIVVLIDVEAGSERVRGAGIRMVQIMEIREIDGEQGSRAGGKRLKHSAW